MRSLPLLSALCLLPTACLAGQQVQGKVIAGWVERIVVLEGGGIRTKAKLDSGAKTSSIHAEKVERFERDGDDWVRFTLVIEDLENRERRVDLEKPLYRNVLIKDHHDESRQRPIVELDICFDGRRHEVQFSLADRGEFIYPVLLGRRFLNDVAVIDPEETYLTKATCDASQKK